LHKTSQSLKQKIKNAFAIIMGAYFTVLVSLLPLMWAGGGLLKGFAITTIIGISIGVFITRPAFGDILKRMGE
jgi:preprotein translocase subunit SecD